MEHWVRMGSVGISLIGEGYLMISISGPIMFITIIIIIMITTITTSLHPSGDKPKRYKSLRGSTN